MFSRLTFLVPLGIAILVSACGLGRAQASFGAGTLDVVVNRTLTPVLTGLGIVGACSELVLDQAALDRWAEQVASPSGPLLPPDTVDLSAEAGEVAGRTGPLIQIITADGSTWTTHLDRAALPACAGRAHPTP